MVLVCRKGVRAKLLAVYQPRLGEEVLPNGPVASQVAIKQLGTNGGGFFNVNSPHPFENPTPLSNFLEMLASFSFADPGGTAFVTRSARWSADRRQGCAEFLVVMLVIFVPVDDPV